MNEYSLYLTIAVNFEVVGFAFHVVVGTRDYQGPRKMNSQDNDFGHLEVSINDVIFGQALCADIRQIRVQAENAREI